SECWLLDPALSGPDAEPLVHEEVSVADEA
ncbi:MAG: hypothetical protein QOH52_2781, partial [Pseudonocardiales bacterium]|nr:hypothetical protein [Pseudonocardiales bacterium]